MKSKLIILLLLFMPICAFAQKETAHWFFGHNAGVDFSSGTAVADVNGQLSTDEGCSSISDKSGNLLFYTDGMTIYNRTHHIMSNGTGLKGHPSSSHSGVIVPDPYNNHLFYVITAGINISPTMNAGLRYSVVDMTLDGGNGAVTIKNVDLLSDAIEKVTAVQHHNGKDVWIIVFIKDICYSFLIDGGGVNTTPVITTAPTVSVSGGTLMLQGCIKISPDGKKLAVAHFGQHLTSDEAGALVLYDFDDTNGKISNERIIANNTYVYGVEFSPNGQYLYASFVLGILSESADGAGEVVQYDLNAPMIPLSKVTLYSPNPARGALQLALDGKIYYTTANQQYLSVINNPNLAGAACGFVYNSFYLGGQYSYWGLPPFITSFFNMTIEINGSISTSDICIGDNAIFSMTTDAIDPTSTKWNFGDGSAEVSVAYPNTISHLYTATGTYLVKSVLYYGESDSLVAEKRMTIHELPQPQITETQNCGETLLTSNYATGNTWSTGETRRNIVVRATGTYKLIVENNYGCKDSTEFTVTQIKHKPLAPTVLPDTVCYNNAATLMASGEAGATFKWFSANNAYLASGATYTTSNLTRTTAYKVTQTIANGCESDTAIVSASVLMEINAQNYVMPEICEFDASINPTRINLPLESENMTKNIDAQILAGLKKSFYTNQPDAENAANAITDAANYFVPVGKNVVWVRFQYKNCYTIKTLTVTKNAAPAAGNFKIDSLVAHDSDNALYFKIQNDTTMTKYNIERSTNSTSGYQTIYTFTDRTLTSYIDENVDVSQEYFYRLSASESANVCDTVLSYQSEVINSIIPEAHEQDYVGYISWNAFVTSASYEFYRNGAYFTRLYATTYTDNDVQTDVYTNNLYDFYYKIIAVNSESGAISISRTANIHIKRTVQMPNAIDPSDATQNRKTQHQRNQFGPIIGGNTEFYEYRMIVFDRWNATVFETLKPMNTPLDPNINYWNGTYKGNVLPEDAYLYYIKIKFKDFDDVFEQKGTVSIIYK